MFSEKWHDASKSHDVGGYQIHSAQASREYEWLNVNEPFVGKKKHFEPLRLRMLGHYSVCSFK